MIQKIGLCICLYDILKASDGVVGHGTGIVNVNGRDFFPLFTARSSSIKYFLGMHVIDISP